MAKKLQAVVKLQLPAGKATPGPPVGSSLGPHGINIPGFTKEFNDDYPRGNQHLLRQKFYLHHEDASRARSYQESARNQQRIGKAQ